MLTTPLDLQVWLGEIRVINGSTVQIELNET